MKELGVVVVFEEQGYDTSQMMGEMLLTMHAMAAQEESFSISKNMRWSYQKRICTIRERLNTSICRRRISPSRKPWGGWEHRACPTVLWRWKCWRDRLETNFEIAGLHQANCLAEVLARPSIDLHKLLCVTDYSDVVCGEDIRKLADHLDDFIFIKGVETPADVGEYITQHENGYPYEALDLPDYFPRLYQKFVEPEQRLSCINHWNYDDPVIWETRLAGPSPKPESKNILEMGGM